MDAIRKIRKVFKSKPTIEGAGVHLKRAFGFGETPLFDPFLLLDDFRSDDPRHSCPASRGIPIAASRPSPTCSRAMSNTAIRWETRV